MTLIPVSLAAEGLLDEQVLRRLLAQSGRRFAPGACLVVNFTRRSRYRALGKDVAPAPDSTSQVGKNYVGQLTRFVSNHWQVERARRHSPSLDRAVSALRRFSPIFGESG